jgi:hypothetical protein
MAAKLHKICLTLAKNPASQPVADEQDEMAVEMALFLRPDRYVDVPLEATYLAAYRGMPAFWRDVLEGRPPQGL